MTIAEIARLMKWARFEGYDLDKIEKLIQYIAYGDKADCLPVPWADAVRQNLQQGAFCRGV